MNVRAERGVEECCAQARTQSRDCSLSPSEPVPVGARGARASGCGRMGGGTAPMRSRATFGVRRPERLASRAPSYGQPGPRREPSGSGPAPLRPARGHLLAARPLRGARRQRPARATWPFKGRWLGPPATRLALPRLCGAPSREGGPAQRLLPLRSLSPSPPSIVPRRGGPGRAPPWCRLLPRPRRRR